MLRKGKFVQRFQMTLTLDLFFYLSILFYRRFFPGQGLSKQPGQGLSKHVESRHALLKNMYEGGMYLKFIGFKT